MRYKRKKENDVAVLTVQPNVIVLNNDKLENLKQRATLRQKRADLRHTPNEHDVLIANENVRVLSLSQYKTIK